MENPTLPKDLFHCDETGLITRYSAYISRRFSGDGAYNIRLALNGFRPKLVHEWEFDASDLEGQSVEIRARIGPATNRPLIRAIIAGCRLNTKVMRRRDTGVRRCSIRLRGKLSDTDIANTAPGS